MTEQASLERVGVAGAGFMGSGIAESAARAGARVLVFEPSQAPLDRSRDAITTSVARAVKGGKLTEQEGKALQSRIDWTTDPKALSDSTLVIEAVVENEQVKRELFTTLDAILLPEAIIASNTSSIPIAQLAAVTGRPDRVLGLHFFSPVPVMKLVEIVVALDTSEASVDARRRSSRGSGSCPCARRTAPASSSTCCWSRT
ncbi:MAG TPA: 3-hydroxyacyl-CoA dehydrogenase NAD-binding domain-containing protein [Conexibacter sp.]